MHATVKDVMTTRVIWVRKDATFRENRVSAFPVIDDDGLAVYDRPDEDIPRR